MHAMASFELEMLPTSTVAFCLYASISPGVKGLVAQSHEVSCL